MIDLLLLDSIPLRLAVNDHVVEVAVAVAHLALDAGIVFRDLKMIAQPVRKSLSLPNVENLERSARGLFAEPVHPGKPGQPTRLSGVSPRPLPLALSPS